MSRIRIQRLSVEVITRSKWGMTLDSGEEEKVAEALMEALRSVAEAREYDYSNRIEIIDVQMPELTR